MAGPIVGIRMINEPILAILKYRDSEIGMSAAYICKLHSPGKKNHLVYKQGVSNFALILINMKKHNSLSHRKLCTIAQKPAQ